ncbi:MAG: hypothetical protein Kow0020_10880 [Wenzhouxiangellaceae bacterium]
MARVALALLNTTLLAASLFMNPAQAAGDPDAGQAKAAVCAACHGIDGNSQFPQWPKIAGQHEDYLERQTRMIRDQQRDAPQMYPIVMNLGDQDIADLAAWYSSQTVSPGVADEALVPTGRRLYHGGDRERGIPACMACHGPTGAGVPAKGWPMLRGQHAQYTADRLRRYRDGQTNGPRDANSAIMAAIAKNLTDEEIEALASYVEGLHPAE